MIYHVEYAKECRVTKLMKSEREYVSRRQKMEKIKRKGRMRTFLSLRPCKRVGRSLPQRVSTNFEVGNIVKSELCATYIGLQMKRQLREKEREVRE